MLSVTVVTVGETPTEIYSGGEEAPPPNRLMGRTSLLIRVREGAQVYIGGPDVDDQHGVRLPVGGGLSLAPVGPTDIIYAVSDNIDGTTLEIIEQGMFG